MFAKAPSSVLGSMHVIFSMHLSTHTVGKLREISVTSVEKDKEIRGVQRQRNTEAGETA